MSGSPWTDWLKRLLCFGYQVVDHGLERVLAIVVATVPVIDGDLAIGAVALAPVFSILVGATIYVMAFFLRRRS